MHAPAGWYPDPGGQPDTFRFWDGTTWTSVTTRNPGTPFPTPGAVPGPSAPVAPRVRSKAPMIAIGVVVLALMLIAVVGGVSTRTRTAVQPTPSAGTSSPAAPSQATANPGVRLNCAGGNNNFFRQEQPIYTSTGVAYTGVAGWGFSYAPSYWTWLDDHTAMGAVNLDGLGNQAGIVIGGIRHEIGFDDQAEAGALSIECLEGTMSSDGPITASDPVTSDRVLGGMPTVHSQSIFTSSSGSALIVDVYVIDSGHPAKWAEIITFSNPGSSAVPLIAQALTTVRPA